jgi:choline dehydrogenase-like flavoprotein
VAPSRIGRAMWMYSKKLTRWAQQHVDPLRPWLLHRFGLVDLALVVRAEQAPNPDSRVLLAEDRDALGVPRVKLDWRTSELDVASVRGFVGALDGEFRRLGLGRVEPAEWLKNGANRWHTDPLISMHPIGGYHHMGTTRMADSPQRGVTDRWGRVHGIGNLYVAGSSLFPTGGWANPTLTIVALALRTADTIAAAA